MLRGLSLYESMTEWCENFTLWIVCLDKNTFNRLNKLNLNNVSLVFLEKIEDKNLELIKSQRSRVEYYWTITPFLIQFVLKSDTQIKYLTYIDADIFFTANPEPIFLEFKKSKSSVLITEHAYSPQYDQSETSGKYCVQFLIFDRDAIDTILELWKKQCFNWCFDRYEDGKFGDQLYLNDWPELYGDKVHILQQKGWALGPWNATRFSWSEGIFYHFHQFALIHKKIAILGTYNLPNPLVKNIYLEYIKVMKKISLEFDISYRINSPILKLFRIMFRNSLNFLSGKRITKYIIL